MLRVVLDEVMSFLASHQLDVAYLQATGNVINTKLYRLRIKAYPISKLHAIKLVGIFQQFGSESGGDELGFL